MKLFKAFEDRGFHSSICTTFDVDFGAYETVALSRLRGVLCNNNILLTDSRMLTYSVDGRYLPRLAGNMYSVVGVTPTRGGVFHPKLVLQLGEKTGRLLVASANMTSAGLGGNLEVVGEVTLSTPDGPEVGLLRAVFDYLCALIPPEEVAAHEQLKWALYKTPWLKDVAPTAKLMDPEGVVYARFLAHSPAASIGSRFFEAVGGEAIRRLIVISPFWDENLQALSWLRDELQPERVAVLLQREAALFPKQALSTMQPVDVYPLLAGASAKASRFVHAKLVIAQSDTADHVLFGSTNCTIAALGAPSFSGKNQEAALYRRMAPGEAVRLLELDSSLAADRAVSPDSLPNLEARDEIPLDECSRRSSGQFELKNSVLTWRRPGALTAGEGAIELLDSFGAPISFALKQTDETGVVARYALEAVQLPSFARLIHNGERFAPSVVQCAEALRFARLSGSSQSTETTIQYLESPEAVEDLKLLEVLSELVRLDQEAVTAAEVSGIVYSAPPKEADPEPSNVLSYDEFIRRRSCLTGGSLAASSTESGLSNIVRQMLNRTLDIRGLPAQGQKTDDVLAIGAVLNLGDETAKRKSAVENGQEATNAKSKEQRQADKRLKAVRKMQEPFKQTQRTIVNAVNKYKNDERRIALTSDLTPVSLLKLRVLLSVILATGCTSENLEVRAAGGQRLVAALLPCRGENSWQWLVGQLLFDVFRWRAPIAAEIEPQYRPLISFLKLPVQNGVTKLPVDVAECLFLCQWAVQSICCGTDEKAATVPPPSRNIAQLRADVYMASDKLIGDGADDTMRQQAWDGLDRRYGKQLGVDAHKIRLLHTESLRALTAASLVAA